MYVYRITKLRENCGKEFEAHWQCLEKNNQEFYACRPAERTFNTCVFEKLVSRDDDWMAETYVLKHVYTCIGFGEEDPWISRRSRTSSRKEESRC
jgi:hypothetical protein